MALAPQPTDLTTINGLTLYMGVSPTTPDADALQAYITSTSVGVASWLDRNLIYQAYSELRNGLGADRMMLNEWPVVSVDMVSYYGTTLVMATNDGLDGVVYDDRNVYLRGVTSWTGIGWWGVRNRFSRGIKNFRFNYSAGYWTPGQAVTMSGGTPSAPAPPPPGVDPLPADIILAIQQMIAMQYKQQQHLGDQAVGQGPEHITYYIGPSSGGSASPQGYPGAMPGTSALIEPYRRMAPRGR